MTIKAAEFNFRLKATETVDAVDLDHSDEPTIVEEIVGPLGTLTPSTVVPVSEEWADTRALIAGSDNLDLTALVKGNLPVVDMTGLRVQLFKVVSDKDNTDDLLIAGSTFNPYEVFGDIASQATIKPGASMYLFGNDSLEVVAAAVKSITVSSGDLDANYSIHIVAG